MFSIFRVYPKSFVSKKRVGYCFHPLRARAYLFFPYCRFWRTVTCVRNPAPGTYRLGRRLTEYISRLLKSAYGRYGLCIADSILFQETRDPLIVVRSPSSFYGVRVLTVISTGNDDFPLAKVECLQGDGKYRPYQGYFARQFSEYPFYAKMGIPKTLKRNSLPYTSLYRHSLLKGQRKSLYPIRIRAKKNSHLWKTDKRIKPYTCRKEQN